MDTNIIAVVEGITIPRAQRELVTLLNQYLEDARDTEDPTPYNDPDPKKRLEDFIIYTVYTRGIKLLDIDHQISVMSEEGRG